MRKMCALSVLLLSVLSCVSALDDAECSPAKPKEDRYPIRVEVELPQSAADSRSSFTEDDLNKITDLNIFIYHEGDLLEGCGGYFTDMSSLMLSLPHGKDGFNIYMFGNVGKMEAPSDESAIAGMSYTADTYDEFRVRGFPVANVFPDYFKGTLALFRLKRLVGQYNITMMPSAVDAAYHVRDVRLLNCALDVYPFGYGTRAERFTESGAFDQAAPGDVLTDEDIERLNAGEEVSLYFVENLQGELLPDNSDRRKKIPSSLEALASGLSDKCTYIEMTVDITTPSAKYTDGKYRFYLGQNETTDFSIRRNTVYDVGLDFTQNMVSEEEWRIEVGAPEIGSLILSKDAADVISGVNDYILISGPRVRVSPDADKETDIGYVLSDELIGGKEYQKLTFYTDKEINGFYSWDTDYRKVASEKTVMLETVEKYNGVPLLSRQVKVYVYDKVFPVMIRMGSNGSGTPYQVEALMNAPVNMELSLSATSSADVGSSTAASYTASTSVMGESSDGFRCCSAVFSSLYNNLGTSSEKTVRFRQLDVKVSGKQNECCSMTDLYMGDGGTAYWGPGSSRFPQKFSNLASDGAVTTYFTHSCTTAGCVRYEIKSGNTPLFIMSPKGRTCNTVHTTGTSNSLSYDMSMYNSGKYIPLYIANGDLRYSYPVVTRNESAKYLDDSARKSIIYEMYGPGRDVFYPNGVKWGSSSENTPDPVHRFGFTAGLVKQFFGNVHTWQIYQDYECDFYMTVNGCTSWPGASSLSTGFKLTYNL